jgi:hypothetical protein
LEAAEYTHDMGCRYKRLIAAIVAGIVAYKAFIQTKRQADIADENILVSQGPLAGVGLSSKSD